MEIHVYMCAHTHTYVHNILKISAPLVLQGLNAAQEEVFFLSKYDKYDMMSKNYLIFRLQL